MNKVEDLERCSYNKLNGLPKVANQSNMLKEGKLNCIERKFLTHFGFKTP